jgi:hypothetical protein
MIYIRGPRVIHIKGYVNVGVDDTFEICKIEASPLNDL